MARSFTSTQGFLLSTSTLTAFPISMFARVEHNSLATSGCILSWYYRVGHSYGSIALYFRGDLAGDPVATRRIKALGVGGNTPASSGSYSINTPTAVGLVIRADNDASIFLDGVETTTAADVDFPVFTPNEIGISLLVEDATNDMGRVGRGQDFTIWDAALTAREMQSLSDGFPPRKIRPQSRKFYWRGLDSLRDEVSKSTLTVVGTEASAARHMRRHCW